VDDKTVFETPKPLKKLQSKLLKNNLTKEGFQFCENWMKGKNEWTPAFENNNWNTKYNNQSCGTKKLDLCEKMTCTTPKNSIGGRSK
jgi:hypothetical protein